MRLRDLVSLQVVCRSLGGARRRTLLFAQFSRPSRGLADALPPAAGSARSHFDRERNGAWWFTRSGHRCRPAPLPHGRLLAHPLASWDAVPSKDATVCLVEATAMVPRLGGAGGGGGGGEGEGEGDTLGASSSAFAAGLWREGSKPPAACHIAALFAHVNREEVMRLLLEPDGLFRPIPVRILPPAPTHAFPRPPLKPLGAGPAWHAEALVHSARRHDAGRDVRPSRHLSPRGARWGGNSGRVDAPRWGGGGEVVE